MKKLCQMIGRFRRFLHRTLDDWMALLGAGLISYGAYLIYVPAGFIVLGLILVGAAVIWSRGTVGEQNDI